MQGWAVVTGASSGIGEEFARELARRGYSVLAVARRRERLEALAKQASAQGGHIEPLTADLATEPGIGSLLQRFERLSEIELLINNAGIANVGDFVEASLDREVTALKLNMEAVVRSTHAALQLMTRHGRGGIINVASVVAFQPFPHFAVYAATKAFVLSFTEALSEEGKASCTLSRLGQNGDEGVCSQRRITSETPKPNRRASCEDGLAGAGTRPRSQGCGRAESVSPVYGSPYATVACSAANGRQC